MTLKPNLGCKRYNPEAAEADPCENYINFPTAVAEAMEFQKGEIVEWIVEDKSPTAPPFRLRRLESLCPPSSPLFDHAP